MLTLDQIPGASKIVATALGTARIVSADVREGMAKTLDAFTAVPQGNVTSQTGLISFTVLVGPGPNFAPSNIVSNGVANGSVVLVSRRAHTYKPTPAQPFPEATVIYAPTAKAAVMAAHPEGDFAILAAPDDLWDEIEGDELPPGGVEPEIAPLPPVAPPPGAPPPPVAPPGPFELERQACISAGYWWDAQTNACKYPRPAPGATSPALWWIGGAALVGIILAKMEKG